MAELDALFRMGVAGAQDFDRDVQHTLSVLDKLGIKGKTGAEGVDALGSATRRAKEELGLFADPLAQVGKGAEKAGGSLLGFSLKAGAIAGGVLVAVDVLKQAGAALASFTLDSVKAAIGSEDATNRLRGALEAHGAATAENVEALKAQASALQETTRVGDDAVMGIQALGLNLGVQTQRIPEFTRAAIGMSTALGVDLDTAAKSIANTLSGVVPKGIGAASGALKALTAEQMANGEGIKLLSDAYGKFVGQDLNTLGGALAHLENQWGDVKKQFGIALLGAGDGTEAVNKLSEALRNLAPAAQAAGTVLNTLYNSALKPLVDLLPIFAIALEGKVGTHAKNATARLAELTTKAERLQALVNAQAGTTAANTPTWALKAFQAQQAELAETNRMIDALKLASQEEAHAFRQASSERASASAKGLTAGTSEPEAVAGASEAQKAAQKALTEIRALPGENQKVIASMKGMTLSWQEREEVTKRVLDAEQAAEKKLQELYGQGYVQQKEYLALREKLIASAKIRKPSRHISDSAEPFPATQPKLQGATPGEYGTAGFEVAESQRKQAEIGRELIRVRTGNALVDRELHGQQLALATAMRAVEESGLRLVRNAQGEFVVMETKGFLTKQQTEALVGLHEAETAYAAAKAARAEAEAQQLAQAILQTGDVSTAQAEVNLARAEAAFAADAAALAVDGLTEAEARHLNQQMKGIEVQRRHVAEQKQANALNKQLRATYGEVGEAVARAALSGERSAIKAEENKLKAQAKAEAVNALIEVAKGIGSLAAHDAAGATAHFASAKAHALAAAAAGIGAAALGAIGGGGGGGRDPDERDRATDSSGRTVAATQASQPPGPQYHVYITGHGVIGAEADVARRISTYLTQFDSESGGRRQSIRG